MLHADWTRIEAPEAISYRYVCNNGLSHKSWRLLTDDVVTWLEQNIGDFVQFPQDVSDKVMYIGNNGRDKIILKFKNEEDALLFKLAWC